MIELDTNSHLDQLSVLPTRARRGIGRSLVTAAQSEARDRGFDRMTLRTYATVPWNAPIYATCGFAESIPDAPALMALAEQEALLGLNDHGDRIQMSALLR